MCIRGYFEMRKIIQISVVSPGSILGLVALCDDGTVWSYHFVKNRLTWEMLPDIPQAQKGQLKEASGSGWSDGQRLNVCREPRH